MSADSGGSRERSSQEPSLRERLSQEQSSRERPSQKPSLRERPSQEQSSRERLSWKQLSGKQSDLQQQGGTCRKCGVIRPAAMEDLPELLALYAEARAFMAANGNPDQWGTSSPPRHVLEEDIRKKRLFICERNRSVCGAFALVFGDDPAYARIEGGAWRSDAPYGTIHRIAGKETERGIFEECLSWCREQTGHIRIDTHEKNAVMRHLIEKNGFVRCGIIHVADGSPRIAYEWTAGGDRTGEA